MALNVLQSTPRVLQHQLCQVNARACANTDVLSLYDEVQQGGVSFSNGGALREILPLPIKFTDSRRTISSIRCDTIQLRSVLRSVNVTRLSLTTNLRARPECGSRIDTQKIYLLANITDSVTNVLVLVPSNHGIDQGVNLVIRVGE